MNKRFFRHISAIRKTREPLHELTGYEAVSVSGRPTASCRAHRQSGYMGLLTELLLASFAPARIALWSVGQLVENATLL